MATSAVPKRSSRLNSHDLSTKAIPGRKLRSRKITYANESSQKVNIDTGNKKLLAVKKVSTREPKKNTNKIHKDSSHGESSKIKQVGKSIKEGKKTRKKKSSIISNATNKNKHRKSIIKDEEITSNSKTLRQMSLKESFAHQTFSKRLRPRQNKKDYCEDSKLLQLLPPPQRNSVVIIEELNLMDNKKLPVYKTMETSGKTMENKIDIYDFKYDFNDTKEMLTKRRKRKRNTNKGSKGIKKVVRKKVTMRSKAVDGANKSTDPDINLAAKMSKDTKPVLIVTPPSESVVTPLLSESIKENVLEKIETPGIVPEMVEETTSSNQVLAVQTQTIKQYVKKQDTKKPRIISIENADNIIVTKSPPPGNFQKDFQSFRPTNIFNNNSKVQHKNTLSISLLTKSLSPILKTYDTFDPGSPWRPPTLPMFSCAKHFVQSTPDMNKMDAVHKKFITHVKDDSHNGDKVANLSDVKNVNPSIQNISDKTSHHGNKNSNLYRKFGTEITNIEYLNNNSTVQSSNIEITNDKPVVETETKPVSNVQLDAIAPESPNYQSFDDIEDKENASPNYQTPKKPTKKKLRKRYLSNSSPSKACENKSNVQKENVDPQPGPSRNVENLENYNNQKVLCQSNLNNFLNLTDMPENTRISTRHGIFDNAHSTPINSNAIKKVNKVTTELENAFGFCEKESELDISPIEDELAINPAPNKVQTTYTSKPNVQPTPARLSLGELRDHLTQKKPLNNNADKQKTDQKDIEVSKSIAEQKNKFVDVMNFSDTYDVLSESERISNCGTTIPLFMDLEPSHFSKPPQHSYKRKRTVMLDLLENSDREEERSAAKTYTKKKKFTKLEKENKKRLDEWVKTVNSTFQEIDEYDLLVE